MEGSACTLFEETLQQEAYPYCMTPSSERELHGRNMVIATYCLYGADTVMRTIRNTLLAYERRWKTMNAMRRTVVLLSHGTTLLFAV